MILAADNLNALNPKVARAMKEFDPAPLKEIAQRCALAGADLLDINPGFLSRRQLDRISFMVESVQEVSDLTLILDSPDPMVLERGIASCSKRPILSALSLEPHKLQGILPLAVEHGTKLVVLLMDERSRVPSLMEERLSIAIELRERALAAGLHESNLIFDPVMPNLTWPDAALHIREAINAIRMLSGWSVFPEPAKTMAGLSNLRSGLRRRYTLETEARCLAMLAGAGLDIVLADVLQPGFMNLYAEINNLAPSALKTLQR